MTDLQITVSALCIIVGICQHYIFMQLRTQNPWKLVNLSLFLFALS